MAKATTRFVCQACGAVTPKWAGRCETCEEWNTVEPETITPRPGATSKPRAGQSVNFVGLTGETAPPPRAITGIDELDRVLGGGLVASSAVLVGGDPGIGKSTLLLQTAARLASSGKRVLYISGEEAIEQVRLRARRLGVANSPIELATSINVRDIVASLDRAKDATLVVIDSIQTMWLDAIDSASGTVSQVRACSFELIRAAKAGNFALVLVGHVTKEGGIAGPRVLEHMVDAVLYFEGDRGHQFRILRAVKNRFGATDEIGVFEMTDVGLAEVANPSALFLAKRRGNIAGPLRDAVCDRAIATGGRSVSTQGSSHLDSKAVLGAVSFPEAGDTFIVGDERTGALDRRGDQQPIRRVTVLKGIQWISTHGRLPTQWEGRHAGMVEKAFDPGLDGPVQDQPPRIGELRDLPHRDRAEPHGAAVPPAPLDKAGRGRSQPCVPIRQPQHDMRVEQEIVRQCASSRPVSASVSPSSKPEAVTRSTPSATCTEPRRQPNKGSAARSSRSSRRRRARAIAAVLSPPVSRLAACSMRSRMTGWSMVRAVDMEAPVVGAGWYETARMACNA